MMGAATKDTIRPAVDADVTSAWAHVRMDKTIQFELPAFAPPEMPSWLRWLMRHLEWAGTVGKGIFWIALFLGAVLVVALVIRLVRRFRIRRRLPVDPAAAWQPDADVARALLAEADAMAALGNYEAAARLLLHRSLEDVARYRPTLIRPSATTREIGAAQAFPASARATFAPIATAVERSLFGGRTLVRNDWEDARSAYTAFALPGIWA